MNDSSDNIYAIIIHGACNLFHVVIRENRTSPCSSITDHFIAIAIRIFFAVVYRATLIRAFGSSRDTMAPMTFTSSRTDETKGEADGRDTSAKSPRARTVVGIRRVP